MAPYTVGWVYNLHESDIFSDARKVIAVAVCFPVLAFVFCGVRFTLRAKTRQLGYDDLATFICLILAIGYSATAIQQTRWGLGLHMKDFPQENIISFSKVQYAGGPIYCLALLCFKLSLILSYLRLAADVQLYRRVLYFAIGLVTVNQIIFTCLLSFACRPIAKQWNPDLEGTCIDQLRSYFALGGTSLILDLILITLPFPILLRLKLNSAKKWGLAALFALGFFVTGIQAVRMFYIANLARYTNSQRIIGWSIMEINLGIIIGCITTFGKIFKVIFDKSGFSSSPSQSQSCETSRPGRMSRLGYLGYNSTNPNGKSTASVNSASDKIWGVKNTQKGGSYFEIHPESQLTPLKDQSGFDASASHNGIFKTTTVSVELEKIEGDLSEEMNEKVRM